jgi:hypothetical protein
MKTVAKCAAIASVLMLTAGSATWAQTYSTTPGTQGTYSGSQGSNYTGNQGSQGTGSQGTYGANQGYQGTYGGNPGTSNSGTNQGSWNSGASQGNWNTGMQGTSTPYSGQTYSHVGYGTGNISTYQEAEQQLSRYGYNNVQDLKAMHGWSADAMRNGQRVHVILGDNGLVATFPGR